MGAQGWKWGKNSNGNGENTQINIKTPFQWPPGNSIRPLFQNFSRPSFHLKSQIFGQSAFQSIKMSESSVLELKIWLNNFSFEASNWTKKISSLRPKIWLQFVLQAPILGPWAAQSYSDAYWCKHRAIFCILWNSWLHYVHQVLNGTSF